MQPRAIRNYVNVCSSLYRLCLKPGGEEERALACLGFRQRENFSVGTSVKSLFFHTQKDGIGLDEG